MAADAKGKPGWNSGGEPGINEGVFVAGIIAELRKRCALGPVYGVGNSNGAGLMQRMGANAGPGLPFRGIIAQATHMMCSPEKTGEEPYVFNHPQAAGPKVCYMSVHGDQDKTIPYDGGPLFGSTEFTLCSSRVSNERWAAHNGCDSPTQLPTPTKNGAVEHYQFDCPTIPTEHYKILGGGHGVQKDVGTEVHFAFIKKCEAAWAKLEGAAGPAGSTATKAVASTTTKAAADTTEGRPTPNACGSGETPCADGKRPAGTPPQCTDGKRPSCKPTGGVAKPGQQGQQGAGPQGGGQQKGGQGQGQGQAQAQTGIVPRFHPE